MYNSILYIGPEGEILGTHRKINITVQELLYHTRGGGGDNLKVFDTDLGKLSGLICGEHYQPTLMQYILTQGSQVNCSLWPGYFDYPGAYSLKTIIPAMTKGVCIAGQLFAVLSSCYVPENERPDDFYRNNAFDQIFGGSCIINPVGETVAGPVYDEETIIYHDIDLGTIPLAKSVVNLTGIYSRWDLINLNVRQKQYEPLQPLETTETEKTVEHEISSKQVEELKAKIEKIEEKLQTEEEE
ncbi:hypothetical protein AKJ49_01675 [candidate division MSBL1 archaeon SCGC-AAA382A03]|uniref:CN hydrolase domain-containing protein n=1 Tax=candidate division MSBL1 archaeon SCGC-AAA382A03 TaxID=1698278 RepID=A0A133VEG9_9EURY|nr:hypothetical protein AKJ49_01675 [candidate division MSBL1 archaeon SCGC-AAA382A03]